MDFVSRTVAPEQMREPAYWFVFQGDKLLMWAAREAAVPLAGMPDEMGIEPARQVYLGYLQDDHGREIDCYGAEIPADALLPDGMVAEGLREAHARLGDELWSVAGRAVQIVTWDRTHQFCGQCGARAEDMPHERAKRCPVCGLVSYPRLSPAIIIAVVRHTDSGDRLLLARNHRFPSGRYSVLAGYVEPGETIEECAHREVCEEVGIEIKNLRYFGSQPWPFPNSLMLGFTAEHSSGEVRLEESELADAQWFAVDGLPGLPPRMTIARRLIDWFVEQAVAGKQ